MEWRFGRQLVGKCSLFLVGESRHFNGKKSTKNCQNAMRRGLNWMALYNAWCWKKLTAVSGRMHVQILAVAKTPSNFGPPLDVSAIFPGKSLN